jgi:hypothetical protein
MCADLQLFVVIHTPVFQARNAGAGTMAFQLHMCNRENVSAEVRAAAQASRASTMNPRGSSKASGMGRLSAVILEAQAGTVAHIEK